MRIEEQVITASFSVSFLDPHSLFSILYPQSSILYDGRGIDFLHIVEVLQRVEQLLHLYAILAGENNLVGRLHDDFAEFRPVTCTLQRLPHRDEVIRCGDDLDAAIVIGHDVFSARIERYFHQAVLVGAGREDHLSAMLEHECNRSVRAQVAAVFGKGMAHVGHGARLVVCHAVHHHRRPVDAVTLVAYFGILHALQFAAAALDRALDIVLGHVVGIGLVHRQAQARIARRIAPAHARGYRDLLDQSGEYLAALGILLALAVLDICPLAVSCHDVLQIVIGRCYHFPLINPICGMSALDATMKTILIANPKGGSGKTTLSVNIAGFLANQGERVAMLDLDRQKSATLWVNTRPRDLPEIEILESKKGEGHLVDWLVIDSPAGLHGKNLAHAIKLSKKIIVPISPSLFDLSASRDFLRTLSDEKETRKCQVGVVGMRMNARTHAAAALENFLAGLDLPILAYLRETQIYVNAAFEGKSLFDLPPHLAMRELEQWEYMLNWLEGKN